MVAGGLGGYYGGRYYDYQSRNATEFYRAPPAYSIQTTTPYMMRVVPRR